THAEVANVVAIEELTWPALVGSALHQSDIDGAVTVPTMIHRVAFTMRFFLLTHLAGTHACIYHRRWFSGLTSLGHDWRFPTHGTKWAPSSMGAHARELESAGVCF
ncbi:hypothetical protein BHE74_00050829, partial [Ensete ventricosum]